MVAGVYTSEESPGTTGQSAGQFPVKATLRKVQQRYTALLSGGVRVERRGKSSPAAWQLVRSVNPTWCKIDKRAYAAARRALG